MPLSFDFKRGVNLDMEYAFLFPGQGSQFVGMGKDLFLANAHARMRLEEAHTILERDLGAIILDGHEEDLKRTENTQPALFLLETLLVDLLRERGITPNYVLGHSLGEYSALYAAGVFDFAVGLDLVAKRGLLMAEVAATTDGAMAAIIGMDKDKIKEILATISVGTVVSANENAPDQTVISGQSAAVAMACEILKEHGAKRAIPLAVSGAFHSPLMRNAAEAFGEYAESIPFRDAQCPVITNVTAQPEQNATKLKALLVEQLLSPVRWVDSLNVLLATGTRSCIEVGPGNVLKGLARKSSREFDVQACNDIASFDALCR